MKMPDVLSICKESQLLGKQQQEEPYGSLVSHANLINRFRLQEGLVTKEQGGWFLRNDIQIWP